MVRTEEKWTSVAPNMEGDKKMKKFCVLIKVKQGSGIIGITTYLVGE